MKWILVVVLVLSVMGLLAYVVMAIQSQKKPEQLGLQQGMLYPCPDSPNCVCSEAHSQKNIEHAVQAIPAGDGVWEALRRSMVDLGGAIEFDDGDYLHATFVSPVFRYVDDVELRRDRSDERIHIRSASRAGRSDFGVNRNRVEQIVEGIK